MLLRYGSYNELIKSCGASSVLGCQLEWRAQHLRGLGAIKELIMERSYSSAVPLHHRTWNISQTDSHTIQYLLAVRIGHLFMLGLLMLVLAVSTSLTCFYQVSSLQHAVPCTVLPVTAMCGWCSGAFWECRLIFHIGLSCYFPNLLQQSFLACWVGHSEWCAFPLGSQTGKLGEGEAERKAGAAHIQG